jgi:predicted TIM-barrel fold metal-dependent hydrolase
MPVDFPIYDADQHYYEGADSFTRHLDPAYSYAFRWVTVKENGRTALLVGDRLFTMISNPTFDPVGKPGALAAYFRGENADGKDARALMGKLEPIHPEYRDRAARAEVLVQQGVAGAFMLPTLALGLEELLHRDAAALYAVLHAFNTWIDEEWGFARDDRIVAPPVMSLADAELAEKELQSVIERGAKAVVFRPAPVVSRSGSLSLADRAHDRFWSMCDEAGVVVAFHAADSGYASYAERFGEQLQFGTYNSSPLAEILSLHVERPISEAIASLIAHGAFDRHPGLKVATVELGSGWVPELVRRMRVSYGKIPHTFASDPVETFHEHVWVTPFQEDGIPSLLDHMHAERILFGSDWPHPEGNAVPNEFIGDLAGMRSSDQRRIMSDNLRELLSLG